MVKCSVTLILVHHVNCHYLARSTGKTELKGAFNDFNLDCLVQVQKVQQTSYNHGHEAEWPHNSTQPAVNQMYQDLNPPLTCFLICTI